MDINLQIENALKNKDIINIMYKATKSFSNQLDEDILYSCKLHALWKAYLNFDKNVGTKFTTYLYNGIRFECLKEIKLKKKYSKNIAPLHPNIADKTAVDILQIDLFDEAKSDNDVDMLKDKMSYLSNGKIAEKHGVTRETLRKRYKKFTKKFEHKFV